MWFPGQFLMATKNDALGEERLLLECECLHFLCSSCLSWPFTFYWSEAVIRPCVKLETITYQFSFSLYTRCQLWLTYVAFFLLFTLFVILPKKGNRYLNWNSDNKKEIIGAILPFSKTANVTYESVPLSSSFNKELLFSDCTRRNEVLTLFLSPI
jgi:hypothetical protein